MVSTLFVRQLNRLDRTLYLKYDRVAERFVVYRNDRSNKPRLILVLQDEHGDFCYPNIEHIAELYAMDSWQNKSIIEDMDAHNARIGEEADQEIHRLNREMSLLMTRTKHY